MVNQQQLWNMIYNMKKDMKASTTKKEKSDKNKNWDEPFNNTASFIGNNINCYPLESLYNFDCNITASMVNGEIVIKE